MSLRNKVFKNTVFNAIGRLSQMAVLLVITPFVFKYLGDENYGVWSIVFLLSGFIPLFTFEFGQTYIKYVSEYYAKKDYNRINEIFNTGTIFYLIISAILILLCIIFVDPLMQKVLKIPPDIFKETKISIILAFAVMCLHHVFSFFPGALNGIQRMDLTNIALIVSSFIKLLGTFFVIKYDYGILGLTINVSVATLAKTLIFVILIAYKMPFLRLSLNKIKKEVFLKLFSFGAKLQIMRFTGTIAQKGLPLIISNLIGLKYVGYFMIARRLANFLQMPFGFFFSSLMPAISHLESIKKMDRVRYFYLKITKPLSFMIFFVIFASCIAIKPIIFAWMGKPLPETTNLFYFLAVSFGINIALTGLGTTIMRGVARPGYEVRLRLFRHFTTIIFSFIGAKYIGFNGVIAVLFIIPIITAPYFSVKFSKFLNLNIYEFYSMVFPPFIAGLIIFFSILPFQNYLYFLLTSRIERLLLAFLLIAIFAIFYILSQILFRVINFKDFKNNITSLLRQN